MGLYQGLCAGDILHLVGLVPTSQTDLHVPVKFEIKLLAPYLRDNFHYSTPLRLPASVILHPVGTPQSFIRGGSALRSNPSPF